MWDDNLPGCHNMRRRQIMEETPNAAFWDEIISVEIFRWRNICCIFSIRNEKLQIAHQSRETHLSEVFWVGSCQPEYAHLKYQPYFYSCQVFEMLDLSSIICNLKYQCAFRFYFWFLKCLIFMSRWSTDSSSQCHIFSSSFLLAN